MKNATSAVLTLFAEVPINQMIKKIRGVIVIALCCGLTFSPVSMTQARTTGDDLLKECQRDATNQEFCLGFILGTAETASTYQRGRPEIPRTFCLPSKISPAELIEIVVDRINKSSSAAMISASGLVVSALARSFPCK